MLSNACVGAVDKDRCAAVFFGVLTKGLQAAMQTYARVVRSLLATRNSEMSPSPIDPLAAVRSRCYRMRNDCAPSRA